MSKKVAELTQVVHILFSRHHEKEVEIEALKDAYEYEIELVQQDARGIIEKLQEQLAAAHQQMDLASQQALNSDADVKTKMRELERRLVEEKQECQKLRDLLIGSERNLERIRGGTDGEIAKAKHELMNARKEIEIQKAIVVKCQQDKEAALKANVEEQQKGEELEKELTKIKQKLDQSNKNNDDLLTRNKKLDSELRSLRASKTKTEVSKARANATDIEEELERLKREVQRYRMEISNRENTYNRVFSDKRPVVVDRQKQDGSNSVIADAADTIQARLARERALLRSARQGDRDNRIGSPLSRDSGSLLPERRLSQSTYSSSSILMRNGSGQRHSQMQNRTMLSADSFSW